MRIFSLFGLFYLLTVIHTQAQAERLLIISDIDDTIKVSHILSTAGKVARAPDVTTPFNGMAELYKSIVSENQQQRRIVYLSNAPETIAGIPALLISHKTFLSYNGFPYGDVELRQGVFDKDHKINTITNLIVNEKPDTLILIGDNGERDPEIYHQIFLKYGARIKIISYIHQIYTTEAPFFVPNFFYELGTKLYPEQIGFVTPVEIALDLSNQEIIRKSTYMSLVENISDQIVDEALLLKWDGLKPITFPNFKNCKEFKWRWSVPVELIALYKKIHRVCR